MTDAWFLLGALFLILLISSIILSWTNFFTLQKLKRTISDHEKLK